MRETLRYWLGRLWGIVGAPIGYFLVVAGLILFVLPGPGIPVLLVGLGILAEREHAWAKRYHGKVKSLSERLQLWLQKLRSGGKQ